MAKVSLIIPPGKYPVALQYDRYRRTPLEGISSLRASLVLDGHDVQVIDCRDVDEEATEHVCCNLWNDTDIVGFTTFFDSFLFVEQCVRRFRQDSRLVYTVVGGPLASAAPRHFLEDAGVDLVVCGEGEESLRKVRIQTDKIHLFHPGYRFEEYPLQRIGSPLSNSASRTGLTPRFGLGLRACGSCP